MKTSGLKGAYCVALICAMMGLFSHVYAVNSDYIQSLMDAKNIEVKYSSKRETDYPSRARPDPKYENTDLHYRVQDVLPFEQDKNADGYVVYPEQGIVYPILTLSLEDKELILGKKKFDHFKYFEEGGLRYIGTSPSYSKDNIAIAIHSSYYTKDPGRYKTAGQATILANIGTKIRYFERQSDGKYTRFEYSISESEITDSSDTSILFSTKNIAQITIYTCYRIGTTESRRYNKGELIGTTKGFSLEKPSNEIKIHNVAPEEKTLETNFSTQSIGTVGISNSVAQDASATENIDSSIAFSYTAAATHSAHSLASSSPVIIRSQKKEVQENESQKATLDAVITAQTAANYLRLYAYRS